MSNQSEDENEVLQVELHSDEEQRGEEEDERIKKLEQDKKSFMSTIKQSGRMNTNIKFDNIESKINTLLENAEKYAMFLLHRHKRTQENKQKVQNQQRGKHRQIIEDGSEEEEFDDTPTVLEKQPTILKGGQLKSYQMTGLNWMISLFEEGINGILADEMGLGKTIQTIGFLSFLKEYKKISGPYLIVAPKSTLGNWMREFKKWLPCMRVVKLIAIKEERDEILNRYFQPGRFDVCLTSYEGVNICLKHIRRFQYKYIIIDEAHKIKNEDAIISQNLRKIRTNYKLLLTGTPLQNTPHELWSLLNYLLPDLFDSSEVFDKWFEVNTEAKLREGNETIHQDELEQRNLEMVQKFQKILRPFMLRRTKAEVERMLPPKQEIHLFIKMSNLQKQMYQNILIHNNPHEGDDKGFYMNKLMQLRKICLHPYLFPEVEDKSLPALGEHLVEVGGKMRVLDKFLQKLSQGQHQILIFSQFTMMLNILEDYCNFRGFEYCRIDGETEIQSRDDQIAEFTQPDSKKFIFLLSTRAGGLGINLATADTVIIYDSDFNPQMDMQAMDRAHRIGQKNRVMVYRMVCEHTVEEKIIERQQIKLRWDSLMVQQGRLQQKQSGKLLSKEDLKELTTYGASQIFKLDGDDIKDEDIDILLKRGEQLTKEMNERIEKKFENFKDKVQSLDLGLGQINIFDYFDEAKRNKEDEEALEDALVNHLMQDNKTRNRDKRAMMIANNSKKIQGKQIKLSEHHLYENKERLQFLLQKEEDFLAQQKNSKKNNENDENLDFGGLTQEERQEQKKLLETGFKNWNKQEFQDFITANEKYGKDAYEKIQEVIKTKTVDEIKAYAQAFWERIDGLSEKDKIVKQIERGQKLIEQKTNGQKLIEEKCKHFHQPKYELVFTPQLYNKFKSKYFSLENDKYLIYMTNEVGYGNWASLKLSIKKEPMFRFDHAFKCKSENELKNRVISLVKVLDKEKENNSMGRSLVKNTYIEKPKVLQESQKKKTKNDEEEPQDGSESVKKVKYKDANYQNVISYYTKIAQENELFLQILQKYRTNQLNKIFSFKIKQLNKQLTQFNQQLTSSQTQACLKFN
ncbi:unnamed protein product [Paramecium sonneborni]|uniref:Uncharacterized protein n=1 Tax=Paramecium sonneborni TaxID=65129 RepID=A0A8S1M1W6_9CILI|nr:unnamed protein product [Paramecium sonneborni]